MYITLPNLIILLIAFVVFLTIKHHLTITRNALIIAKASCEKNTLQFLDQSIVFSGFKLIRNTKNRYILGRQFTFEFSTLGDERYKGRIIMNRSTLYNIDLDTYKEP